MKKIISITLFSAGLLLISCSTTKTCHAKKAYVSKEVLRAQSKPRH